MDSSAVGAAGGRLLLLIQIRGLDWVWILVSIVSDELASPHSTCNKIGALGILRNGIVLQLQSFWSSNWSLCHQTLLRLVAVGKECETNTCCVLCPYDIDGLVHMLLDTCSISN